ncbi:MAG: hypothetical protein ACO1OB_16865 [Archangium sp.]
MDVRRLGWVVVFTGVAVAALGLVSLGEWDALARALDPIDLGIRFDVFDPATDWFAAFYSDDHARLQQWALVVLAVAVGGLVLSSKWPLLGSGLVTASLWSCIALAVLYVRYVMVVGRLGTLCGPPGVVRTAHDFIDVREFAVLFSVVAASALWVRLRSRDALISGASLVVMMSAALWLGAFEARVVIIVTAFFSFALARWFEATVPRNAVALSVPLFIAGAWSTAAIAHDTRAVEGFQSGHRKMLERDGFFTASRCGEASFAPTFGTYDGDVTLFGRTYDGPIDSAAYEHLSELRAQMVELVGEPEMPVPYAINVAARRDFALADFFAVLRGFSRLEGHADFVTLLFLQDEEAPLWTRASIHQHTCGLHVRISDEGRRESEFENFEALFNAAAKGGLTLSVR